MESKRCLLFIHSFYEHKIFGETLQRCLSWLQDFTKRCNLFSGNLALSWTRKKLLLGWIYSHFTSVGKGKGLATFSKIPFQENVSLVDKSVDFRLMSVKIKNIMIVSVCLSSNCSNLEAVVQYLSQNKTEKCLIMGDFNFTPSASNIITKKLHFWNLAQLIKSFTHKDGNILDHVYVSKLLSAFYLLFWPPGHVHKFYWPINLYLIQRKFS